MIRLRRSKAAVRHLVKHVDTRHMVMMRELIWRVHVVIHMSAMNTVTFANNSMNRDPFPQAFSLYIVDICSKRHGAITKQSLIDSDGKIIKQQSVLVQS